MKSTKLHGKRFLSLLLAVLLLFAAMPTGALAAESTVSSRVMEVPDKDYAEVSRSRTAAQSAGYTDLYSMLTPQAKKYYDFLKSLSFETILAGGGTVELPASQLPAGTIKATSTSSGLEEDPNDPATRTFLKDVYSAMIFIRYDHPELDLWMGDSAWGYSASTNNNVDWKITKLSFVFRLPYGGAEGEMYNKMMAAVQEIGDGALEQSDRYTQMWMIHDLLAMCNTYAYDEYGDAVTPEDSPLSYSPYSALVGVDPLTDGEVNPVCQGYAYAFKMVCDYIGVPCAIVVSESHAWNNVKMDDGLWYNVDVTWDDNAWDALTAYGYTDEDIIENMSAHDYFLAGSDTEIDGTKFCEERAHVEVTISDDYAEQVELYRTVYPQKSAKAYDYLGHDYAPARFQDVTRYDYFFNAVEWAAGSRITSGITDTTFAPGDDCTRAQAVAFLWRAAGRPEPDSTVNPFTDVSKNDYFYKAVLWAVENRVTFGTTDTTFTPNGNCTRAEIVSFMWRNAGRPDPVSAANPFVDVSAGQYYTNPVLWAVENNITFGTTSTTFAPTDKCSRAQIVSFLYRYFK